MKVVGLGGSLAARSASLAALKIALEGAAEAGAEAGMETELLDLRSLDLPMYVPGMTPVPEAALRLIEFSYEAQGMIWCSPLYQGTMSGAFKNALDWLHLMADRDPPYLTDKVVGLISTAGGVLGLQGVISMEFAVRSLRAWAVPLVLAIPRVSQAFDSDGHPTDAQLAGQLRHLGREVTRAARQMARDGFCDYSEMGDSRLSKVEE
jgi:FMN reductase